MLPWKFLAAKGERDRGFPLNSPIKFLSAIFACSYLLVVREEVILKRKRDVDYTKGVGSP